MSRLFFSLLLVSLLASNSGFAETSTTSVTKTAVKKEWGGSYSNYLNGPALSGPPGGSANHYFNLSKKFKKNWSVTATGRLNTQWTTGKKDANTVGDHYLKLGIPALYKGDKVTVTSQLRYYYPASESSKKKNLDFAISPRVYVTGSAGKTNLTYIFIPKFSAYSQVESNQSTVSQGHWLSAAYGLWDWLTLDFAAYPGWNYKRDGNKSFNNIPVYPGATIKIGKNASVSTYMEIIAQKPQKETSSFGASVYYKMF